jgi:hypothetical protein
LTVCIINFCVNATAYAAIGTSRLNGFRHHV